LRAPDSRSPIRDSRFLLLPFAVFLLLAAGCAAHRPRSFAPASDADVPVALGAWKRAVERAESMPSSRLLYDARLSQGVVRVPGTLAVRQSPTAVEASLTGPFGSPIAAYTDGALRGAGIKPVSIAPEELRFLLAGAWERGAPEVRGFEGGEALLVWPGAERVEGVLDVREARFRSLQIRRREGEIHATYSGELDPWPERIEVVDARTGAKLRLTLIGKE